MVTTLFRLYLKIIIYYRYSLYLETKEKHNYIITVFFRLCTKVISFLGILVRASARKPQDNDTQSGSVFRISKFMS